MPTPPPQNLTVVRYATGWGFAAAEWERALAGAAEAACLKRFPDGSCRVWRTVLTLGRTDREVVVKLRPLGSWRKLVQSWLGLSQHARQWRGAERLASRGFRAARGLALLRGDNGGTPVELLVLESIPGATALEHLSGGLTVRRYHALALALGRHAADMAAAGISNRDSKPSNLIIEWKGATPTIAVVDTVAIRAVVWIPNPVARVSSPRGGAGLRPVVGGISRTQARRSLARTLRDLLLEPLGCGLAIPRTDMMRALRATTDGRGRSWKQHRNALWHEVADAITAHGDATPAVDPFGMGASDQPPPRAEGGGWGHRHKS